MQASVLTPVNPHRRNRVSIAAGTNKAMDGVMPAARRRTGIRA
ncbi:hypothetical protein [Kocuria palustris]|nr:hypothetical protein [Kocuria palustris]